MDEMMTFEEIEKKYDDDWILVECPEDDQPARRGIVLCHSKDRDEVYRCAIKLRPKRSAILCTVKIPEDMVMIL